MLVVAMLQMLVCQHDTYITYNTHLPVRNEKQQFIQHLQPSTLCFNVFNAFATFLQKWICEAPQSCNYDQPDAVHC